MGEYVLGLDGGGTKTVCLLADLRGWVHGRGAGGTGNPFLASPATIRETIETSIRAAAAGGTDARIITSVCLGFAGAGSGDAQELLRSLTWEILDEGRFAGRWTLGDGFGPRGIQVVSDPVIALVAGAGSRNGIVAISGTGSIVHGETEASERAVVGGWGSILSGEGSGHSIGTGALRAVLRAEDGRGPATCLGPEILQHWGFQGSTDLFRSVARGEMGTVKIAALVPLVYRAAKQNDTVAMGILSRAGSDLAEACLAVARRLDLLASPFQLVCSGGVLRNCEPVRETMSTIVRAVCPECSIVVLQDEPAVGAVRLAVDAATARR
jgi:N-acetylglucosamine kinase-like BadF-type ATPase